MTPRQFGDLNVKDDIGSKSLELRIHQDRKRRFAQTIYAHREACKFIKLSTM